MRNINELIKEYEDVSYKRGTIKALIEDLADNADRLYEAKRDIMGRLSEAILAYWASNGGITGKCFKAKEYGSSDRDLVFRILDSGRQDGNNRLIYLAEYFYPNREASFNPGRYGIEWRAIETMCLSPKNVISLEEYKKELDSYKAQWEEIIRGEHK